MPIAPKKRNIFAAGLFGGLFLGLLIALARQMITKFKSQAGGTLWCRTKLELVLEMSSISATLLLEPVGRNTAPALTLATLYASEINADQVMILFWSLPLQIKPFKMRMRSQMPYKNVSRLWQGMSVIKRLLS